MAVYPYLLQITQSRVNFLPSRCCIYEAPVLLFVAVNPVAHSILRPYPLSGKDKGLTNSQADYLDLFRLSVMASHWQSFFDDHAAHYMKNQYTSNNVAEVDLILEELSLPSGSLIPDIGCGTGRHAIELANRGYQGTGKLIEDVERQTK